MEMKLIERFRGSLLGLAVGDMLGARLEFKKPGSFSPITCLADLEKVEGPWDLPLGIWTDDSSLALCLGQSLVDCERFDPVDQLKKYARWYREGYMSCVGHCFDIGNTTRASLELFEQTGEPYPGSTKVSAAGNGSLMRLAPVPLRYYLGPVSVLQYAGRSSQTTHGAAECVDACRYLAWLIFRTLHGWSKEEIYEPPQYLWDGDPFCWWAEVPLGPKVAEIANGSFKIKNPPQIRGSGYVVNTLEAALWAFYNTASFEAGALAAINLGEDTDTVAAVYGQLAGAYYGEKGIPQEWRSRLMKREMFENLAEQLYILSAKI